MIKYIFSAFFLCIQLHSHAQIENIGYGVRTVVLGSSTAAGYGPSVVDSAWVWRLEQYMKGLHPDNEVINLAVGGYTTYQLMPADFAPPAERPMHDPVRNISYALTLSPDLIIINLPSNDVGWGYSVKEQLDNFRTMTSVAKNAGIPYLICTTQPRNFPKVEDRKTQFDLFDSIQAIFPDNNIDFWTGLADNDLNVDISYDSGDGVHLNDEGHRILIKRVLDTGLPDVLYAARKQYMDSVLALNPGWYPVRFTGKIYFGDSTVTLPRRINWSHSKTRSLDTTLQSSKYDVREIVDLKNPFDITYSAPGCLSKKILFDFRSISREDMEASPHFRPIESLDIQLVRLKDLMVIPNDTVIPVAFFDFDSDSGVTRLDSQFSHQQKRYIDYLTSPVNNLSTADHNGRIIAHVRYKNGLLHGKCTWSNNFKKEVCAKFKKGMYHGKFFQYDTDGNILYMRKYRKNKLVRLRIYNQKK